MKEESRYMRFIVNFWTLVTFAAIILDFTHPGKLTTLLGPILALYAGSLALYSAEKEFERWNFYFSGKHPGEVYVMLWTVLIFGIFAWGFITHSAYKMEPDVVATYILVLGILAITKKSKMFYKELCKKDPAKSHKSDLEA